MQECHYALLCLPVPTSLPLPPPLPSSSLPPVFQTHTHTHTHTYIHMNIHTHIPHTAELAILHLTNVRQRSALVTCIILASLLLDIHGFIYKSLCSTFFSPISVVYITGIPVFLWEFQIRIKI